MFYYRAETKSRYSENTLRREGLYPNSKGVSKLHMNIPNYNQLIETYIDKGTETLLEDGSYSIDIEIVPLADTAIQINLDGLKEEKRKQALKQADDAVSSYMSLYSEVEKDTWEDQKREVEAYLANPTAPTPTLDALAKTRGIDRDSFLIKTIDKVSLFKPLSIFITGTQQKYEDSIKALASNETKTLAVRVVELQRMYFDYTLPNQNPTPEVVVPPTV